MDLRTFLTVVILVSILSLGESLQEDIEAEESERVVGGKTAGEGDYPWTVALFKEGTFICTGIIISDTSILTAAHCVVADGETPLPGNFYAIAGVADRTSKDGTFIEFRKISVHPEYDQMNNDIAVLETAESIEFGKRVQRICIANDRMGSLSLRRVVAMGWGQTNRDMDNPDLPDILQYSKQRVVSNLKCMILFYGNPVPSSIMCATGVLSGICGGDSGGPLVYYARKRPVLVGVASYVNAVVGCGRFLGPAAFTRVSSYTQDIVNMATGDVCVA